MVSFKGIDNLVVTMLGQDVSVDGLCKMKSGKTVTDAASGEEFHGVCQWLREGLAGVLVKGFVTMPYSGATPPAVGYGQLCSDGKGGVTVASSGPSRLIVDVDTTGKTVTFYL